jgi:hypothetical protein
MLNGNSTICKTAKTLMIWSSRNNNCHFIWMRGSFTSLVQCKVLKTRRWTTRKHRSASPVKCFSRRPQDWVANHLQRENARHSSCMIHDAGWDLLVRDSTCTTGHTHRQILKTQLHHKTVHIGIKVQQGGCSERRATVKFMQRPDQCENVTKGEHTIAEESSYWSRRKPNNSRSLAQFRPALAQINL